MSAVEDAAAGRISPEVAVARMVMAGLDAAAMAAALQGVDGAAAGRMRALVAERGAGLDDLAREIRSTVANHHASGATPAEGVARIAAFFDGAVQYSPEASVAVYSLGDPAILAQATAEVVAWLEAEGLLRAGMDVVDLGCGIGRVAGAVAPLARTVLALDVSPGMVAEAARRLAGQANVAVRVTGGEDLDALAPGSADLVLAIDSFPYLVQTGEATALAHVAGAARALRPGGALVVLNFSYEGEANDRRWAAAWAGAAGLQLVQAGVRPFRLWDGTAYVFVR